MTLEIVGSKEYYAQLFEVNQRILDAGEGTIVYAKKSGLPYIVFFETYAFTGGNYCVVARLAQSRKKVGMIKFSCLGKELFIQWLDTAKYTTSFCGIGTALMEMAMKIGIADIGVDFRLSLTAIYTAPLFYYTLGLRPKIETVHRALLNYTSTKFIKKYGIPSDEWVIEMVLPDYARDWWVNRIKAEPPLKTAYFVHIQVKLE